jgi:hypothetical protein
MGKRASITAALLSAVVTAAPAVAAELDTLVISQDQAKILRIAAPAATIIIGNPSIADATMQDSQTLVITGRSSGTTNFIVLDSGGEPIAEQLISVEGPSDNNISVYRGPQRFSYNCAPNCQPNVVPGDNPDYFATVTGQNASRTSTAAGNADVEAR